MWRENVIWAVEFLTGFIFIFPAPVDVICGPGLNVLNNSLPTGFALPVRGLPTAAYKNFFVTTDKHSKKLNTFKYSSSNAVRADQLQYLKLFKN